MNVLFAPYPGAQERFMSFKGRYALYGGRANTGKTEVLIYDPFRQIKTESDRVQRGEIRRSIGRALLLRRTYDELREILGRVWPAFEAIDPDGKSRKTAPYSYTFSCGYEYVFGNMEQDDDWRKYYGLQLTWLGFDELTHFTQEQFEHLDTRVRSADPVLRNMLSVRAGTNPLGKGLEWVRKRFVEVAPPGTMVVRRIKTPIIENGVKRYEWIEREQIYIQASMEDNPASDQREYAATLADKAPEIRKALLEGDWYAQQSIGAWASGYWDPLVHVCKPFKLPKNWPKFRACKFGNVWPAASSFGWFGVDYEGSVVCYRTLNVTGLDAHEQAQMVKNIELENNEWDAHRDCSMLSGPLNVECFPQDGHTGTTIEEIFRGVGVFWSKGCKSKEQAAEQLRVVLRRRTKHSLIVSASSSGGLVRPEREVPGVRFFDTCGNFVKKPNGEKVHMGPIATIPMLPKDEKNTGLWVKNGMEHDLEMVALAAMYRSPYANDDSEDDEDKPRGGRNTNHPWASGGYFS